MREDIPLTEDEKKALDGDEEALGAFIERSADVLMPAGKMPREMGSDFATTHRRASSKQLNHRLAQDCVAASSSSILSTAGSSAPTRSSRRKQRAVFSLVPCTAMPCSSRWRLRSM